MMKRVETKTRQIMMMVMAMVRKEMKKRMRKLVRAASYGCTPRIKRRKVARNNDVDKVVLRTMD
jgi:hypothetical protein